MKKKLLTSDGVCGAVTRNSLLDYIDQASLKPNTPEQTAFSCPHCGGNKTKVKDGKKVCAYCESEIVSEQVTGESIVILPPLTSLEVN